MSHRILRSTILCTCLLSISGRAGTILLQDGFDSYPATKARIGDSTNRYSVLVDSGRTALRVDVPDSLHAVYLNYNLPLDTFGGCVVRFSASTKGTITSGRKYPFNGVKVMLSVKRADSTNDNPQLDFPDTLGSYGWTSRSRVVTIPGDALKAVLVVGLESVAGSTWFDSIRIEKIGSAKIPPARDPLSAIPHSFGPERLRGAMISVPSDSASIANFGSNWKGNLLRWQLNWAWDKAGKLADRNFDSLLQVQFANLDQRMPLFRANGIRIIIDLHTMSWGLFDGAASQAVLIDTWRRIARRYGGNPAVAGYDLANEPDPSSWQYGALLWNELVDTLSRTIRAVDPTTPIVVEPAGGDIHRFSELQPVGWDRGWDIPNMVYSFHFYSPASLTSQGADASSPPLGTVYPGTIDNIAYDSARLRLEMQPAIDFQNRYRVPMFVGEFSCIRWAPQHSALNWLKDVTSILETQGWDWTYHAYREYNGWSVEYSDSLNDMRSNLDTDRKALLLSLFARNTNPYTALAPRRFVSEALRGLRWTRSGGKLRVSGIPTGSVLEVRGADGRLRASIPSSGSPSALPGGVCWIRLSGAATSRWEPAPISF